jgi:hypothetical protein
MPFLNQTIARNILSLPACKALFFKKSTNPQAAGRSLQAKDETNAPSARVAFVSP